MKLLTILSAIVLLAYPFVVYYGLNQWGVGTVAGVFGLLFFLRILGGNKTRLRELKYIAWASGLMGLVLTIFAIVFKEDHWFTYYPVGVNFFLFLLFFGSLWQKETLVERFARLQESQLPDYVVAYTRTVTKVWCCFFIANGAISLTTSFISMELWTLYNGLISYLLVGLLFISEWLVRLHIKRKNNEV